MRGFSNKRSINVFLLLLSLCMEVVADERAVESYHLGFMYPNGVDVVGYTAEQEFSNHLYRFYTFGIPSFAAVGGSYYKNFIGDGLSATFGLGIGSIAYCSVAYQMHLRKTDYIKLGTGFTTGVAYTGAYPALSYEHRF